MGKTGTGKHRNISENLLTLRRRLKISQQTFIEIYLSDIQGRPIISVPTLSNIENGSIAGTKALAEKVSEKLNVDKSIFLMDPDDFARNIELFLGETLEDKSKSLLRNISTSEALVDSLSDYLMDEIIHERLRPGSKLPSDRELSARFGVGRTTLREALRVLGCLGIVSIQPGHGTFLSSKYTGFHVSLSWTVLLGQHSIDNLINMRSELEVVSSKLAAQNADTVSMTELDKIFKNMKTAFEKADFKDFLDLDLDFHLAIAACSRNTIIHDLLATSRRMLEYISKSGMVTPEDLQNIYTEHGEIYTAIVNKDSHKAQEKMTEHLAHARLRYNLTS